MIGLLQKHQSTSQVLRHTLLSALAMTASLLVVAMLLGTIAIMYGMGAIGSLFFRAVRLAFARNAKLSLLCVFYLLVVAVLAYGFSEIVWNTRSSAWPFEPIDIPFYGAYIALCDYLANRAPKKWVL